MVKLIWLLQDFVSHFIITGLAEVCTCHAIKLYGTVCFLLACGVGRARSNIHFDFFLSCDSFFLCFPRMPVTVAYLPAMRTLVSSAGITQDSLWRAPVFITLRIIPLLAVAPFLCTDGFDVCISGIWSKQKKAVPAHPYFRISPISINVHFSFRSCMALS